MSKVWIRLGTIVCFVLISSISFGIDCPDQEFLAPTEIELEVNEMLTGLSLDTNVSHLKDELKKACAEIKPSEQIQYYDREEDEVKNLYSSKEQVSSLDDDLDKLRSLGSEDIEEISSKFPFIKAVIPIVPYEIPVYRVKELRENVVVQNILSNPRYLCCHEKVSNNLITGYECVTPQYEEEVRVEGFRWVGRKKKGQAT